MIEARAALGALNSSLFYWFITLLSDCRHLNKREVEAFPIPSALIDPERFAFIDQAVTELMADLQTKSEHRVMNFRHDRLTVQCILPKKSWASIQHIDALIADAVQLSPVEADYIASYDMKYRIGQGMDDNDD